MENSLLKEYRCDRCNKLLFKGSIAEATIEVKCRGCKNINTVQINKPTEEPQEEEPKEE